MDFVKNLHADEVVDAKIDIKKRLNLPFDFDETPKKDKKKSLTDKNIALVPIPELLPRFMSEFVYESELNEKMKDDVDNISSDAESVITGLQIEEPLDTFFNKEEREDITPDKDELNMDRISEDSFHTNDRTENQSAKVIESDDDFDSYDQSQLHSDYNNKPPSLIQISEDESDGSDPNEECLTLIAVLRILTVFEDYLGSLGPKILDLLSKAIALEKVKPNLADEMLMNETNSVLLELCKEKLTGLLLAEIIERHKIRGVKKAIKNIKAMVKTIDRKVEEKVESEKLKAAVSSLSTAPTISDEHFENLRKFLPSIISNTSKKPNFETSKKIEHESSQFANFSSKNSSFSAGNIQLNYYDQTNYQNHQQLNQSNVNLKNAQQKLNLEFSFLNSQNSSRNVVSSSGVNNFVRNPIQNNSSITMYSPNSNEQRNYMDHPNNKLQNQNQFQQNQRSFEFQQKTVQKNPQSSFTSVFGETNLQNKQDWTKNPNNFQQSQIRNILQNNERKRPSQKNMYQFQDNIYKTSKMAPLDNGNMYAIQNLQSNTIEKQSSQYMQNRHHQQNNLQPSLNQQLSQSKQNSRHQNQQKLRNQVNSHQQSRQRIRNQPEQRNQQNQRNSTQQKNTQRSFKNSCNQNDWHQISDNLFKEF